MPRALLLTALPTVDPDENASLLAPALRSRGWEAHLACIDALHLASGGVGVDGPTGSLSLADFDLVWVLGFGRRETFLDKMQLLATVSPATRFVNSVSALLTLHGKYPFPDAGTQFPHPETLAHTDPAVLLAHARTGGGRWVIKPPGGSFGRDVHILEADAPELGERLQAGTAGGRYLLLQRFCPEAIRGEHRVLVAGGRVIGAYRRGPAPDDCGQPGSPHRPTNLARGAEARPADPDAERDAIAERAARWLLHKGVAFAGLDLAGPWVLEANIVNPGGLATLATLGAGDRAGDVVDAVLAGPA